MTLDERFLIKLYEMAAAGGDPKRPMNYQAIAKMLSVKETALKTIIRHLAQANFIKKIDETTLQLTERGCRLAADM